MWSEGWIPRQCTTVSEVLGVHLEIEGAPLLAHLKGQQQNACCYMTVQKNLDDKCFINTINGVDVLLTENLPSWVGHPVVGESLTHTAGECCFVIPVISGNGEVSSDGMEARGFRKVNIQFLGDVGPVGLKGHVEVTGGELCDVALQQSTVSSQQVWQRSSNQHRWSSQWRPWATNTCTSLLSWRKCHKTTILDFLDSRLTCYTHGLFCGSEAAMFYLTCKVMECLPLTGRNSEVANDFSSVSGLVTGGDFPVHKPDHVGAKRRANDTCSCNIRLCHHYRLEAGDLQMNGWTGWWINCQ